ncbi:oxidoreductase [Isoptericola sp. b441]|uniref:Oxidoreductase n=1 Tax=Actinotalea lenta TaxID=3064654 RepID=A0ABT9DEQ4_9CELL|nr:MULTISPECIES: oxidoreductase [unclassified Isoptericola]MDO8107983.1 oxidoreductase [Isoptericola sp. b441]MDO8120350.1 oxidoreductase [Isoptericola sp. b490]
MPLFRRRSRQAPERDARHATLEHLAEFARTRVGVEAYIEPQTNVTQTTVVLIATSGEWTRRRVPSPGAARKIAQDLGIPVYDVQLVGYPQRMRDWNARQRSGR